MRVKYTSKQPLKSRHKTLFCAHWYDILLLSVWSLLTGSALFAFWRCRWHCKPSSNQRGEQWRGAESPGEPDCACLFRLLESILCSIREDSCYYNFQATFHQSPPPLRVQNSFLLTPYHTYAPCLPSQPHCQKSNATWHLLSYGITSIYDLRPVVDLLSSQESVLCLSAPKQSIVCVHILDRRETPHHRDNYITVLMVTHL